MKNLNLRKMLILAVVLCFLANSLGPIPTAQAQLASPAGGDFRLPVPGVMVNLSPEFNPPVLKGMKVYPDNPLRFDFILAKGDSQLSNDALKDESSKLIKYFLASLTIPEKDLWVNLSPYEKDRIIPNSFGLTEMGRDLLAEDYMLKQITASLIYPEDKIGKKFWIRLYEEANKRYGTTNIPVNTFNKVWILPSKAVVYENAKAGTAYVIESKLKVMLEQDYLSLERHERIQAKQKLGVNEMGSQVVREILLPQLEKEVNEGKNFATLRQVYNSLILAAWYKKKIKDSILAQVYSDKNKIAGVNINDPQETQRIYERYLRAFKKGVFNYIKEEIYPLSEETIPRKYFSGGIVLAKFRFGSNMPFELVEKVRRSDLVTRNDVVIGMVLGPASRAMLTPGQKQIKDGWAFIDQMMEEALQNEAKRGEEIDKIIVYLRLRDISPYNNSFRRMNDIGTDIMRNNLIKLLERPDVPLFKKRLLLQSFPRGETYDYKAVARTARELEYMVNSGIPESYNSYATPRAHLVGFIRTNIHDNPELPEENIALVERYKAFVETDGREGVKGKTPNDDFHLDNDPIVDKPWEFPEKKPALKAEVLRLCNLLLVSLKRYTNATGRYGESKVNIDEYMDAYMGDFLETPQRHQMAEKIDRIMGQVKRSFKDLEDLVEIRQEVNERIGRVVGPSLLQGLKLDLYLENLIHQVFITMKEDESRFSPEALLLMLKNNRLSGYGGELVDQLIGLLEEVLKEQDSAARDMQLYSIFQRSERVIKRVLEQGIQDYQDLARYTGKPLAIKAKYQGIIEDFSANLFRDNTFYLLSILIKHLKDEYEAKLGLTENLVVAEGQMYGNLHFVSNLEETKQVGPKEILVMDHLPVEFPVDGQIHFAGIVVFELDSLLSHPAINVKQNRIPFIVCPRSFVQEYLGRTVTITARKEHVTLEVGGTSEGIKPVVVQRVMLPQPEKGLKTERYLLPENYKLATAGPKAYHLHSFEKHVPLSESEGQRYAKHMVLSDTIFQDVLNLNEERRDSINSLRNALAETGDQNTAVIKAILFKMREDIESLVIPDILLMEIRDHIRSQIPTGLVFLRSSSNAEDLENYSGAGLYDSIGAVDPEDLIQLQQDIKKIWASVWKDRTYWDRKYHGLNINEQNVYMPILVHEMVSSDYSYVIHTVNPANHDPNEIVLEIVQGFGEGLVSGVFSGTPHKFIFDRRTHKIRRGAYSSKDYQFGLINGGIKKAYTDWRKDDFRKLTPDVEHTLYLLFQQAINIQDFFGSAQDIEGAIVVTGQKFETVAVQSRAQDLAMKANEMVQLGSKALLVSQVPDNGGIDFTASKTPLEIMNGGQAIKFHLDPAMLQQLQNAPGFVPIIINIQPMTNLALFLGINPAKEEESLAKV